MTKIMMMSVGILIFCGVLINMGNVFAYENQTNTVVKNYDAWYDFDGWGHHFFKLTDGYVSVEHNVNVTLAAKEGNVEVCDPFSFSYLPTIFFTATNGGTWDTPYGIWKNSIDAKLTGGQIQGSHGQRVWSVAAGGTSRPGDISWSAVAPTPTFSSSDENVVTCNNLGQCEAINEGTATVTVNIPETQARLWGIIYPGEVGCYPSTMRVFYNKHTYTLKNSCGFTQKTFSAELQSVTGKDNRDNGILILPSPDTPMSWDITVVPDLNPTGECALADGRCNPNIDSMPITEYPTGQLCCEIKNGGTECVPTDKYESIVTENDDGTYSWTCAGVYGGNEAECKTIRDDCAACDSKADGVYTDVRPEGDGLCIVGTATPAEMNSEGKWFWDCEFPTGDDDCKSAACEAPSCLSENPLTANPQFIYEGEGTETVTIGVSCPNNSSDNSLCCTLGVPYNIEICNGDTTQIEIPKDASQTQIDALCGGIPYSIVINTMCMAKSCNAQGTCQAMPFTSESEKCTSTCNSDADCTKGRLIETKP